MRTAFYSLVLSGLGLVAPGLAAKAAGQEIPRPEHPEPLAVREHWSNLNGPWEFRFDPKDEGEAAGWSKPGAEGFDRQILVPFPWESKLSGIEETSKEPEFDTGWYRRTFNVPADFPADDRVILHFGAVDWEADVWVNDTKVAEHEGGYAPFEADVTEQVQRDGPNTVVVRAHDTTDPSHPVGKQVGWYTTTSGIWQTVWLESRPEAHIDSFTIGTNIDPAQVVISLTSFSPRPDITVGVRSDDPSVSSGDRDSERLGIPAINNITFDEEHATSRTKITLNVSDPKLWSPESPTLYPITLELKKGDQVVDSIQTYFGLRTIERGKLPGEDFERLFLNGKPYYFRGALDQSFNPDGIYTAPSDEFLRNDILLAKLMGTNFLRIHIKPEEPRRLYWADKLGMLIMEDMPNTWRQNEQARATWEPTMRAIVSRDVNHPSIFAWVAFNETWGLNHPEYKQNQDTQEWVKEMVADIRQLDSTRLVEDNSPCNYDHVEGSDLNSWHFYIDNHDQAAEHIADVVEKTRPGSEFNYVPGQEMNSAPLINSEYGSVSAGGGDRDVSWGFRDLTTLLRKYDKIQGYIYTELTDIEWEHNGFANYDRSPKVFGYNAFVPGMTPADLQGADFVGYDGPPAIVAKVGEEVTIKPFVSHYSELSEAPTLRWWTMGTDANGEPIATEPQTLPVTWKPYGVSAQTPITTQFDAPFVGAIGMEIVDSSGRRLAANFENVVVQGESPAPRVERIDDHTVAIRFAPQDYAAADWSGEVEAPEGKVHAQGEGSFQYRLKLPEAVVKAGPRSIGFRGELAAKAGHQKVDWAERSNPQDYPQTETQTWPSSVVLTANKQPVATFELLDDPADARGVLSHVRGVEHGSFGYWIHAETALPEPVVQAITGGEPLTLEFRVPEPNGQAGGLAIFGASTGAVPSDPTILIQTTDPLPADLGVNPAEPAAVDSIASKRVAVLKTGESAEPTEWQYSTEPPTDDWMAADFKAKEWRTGAAGFGTRQTPGVDVRTRWNRPEIWLRTAFEVQPADLEAPMVLRLFHDEDVEIFVNGKSLLNRDGYGTSYEDLSLTREQARLFQRGRNTIAVHCRQTQGGQGVDIGLTLLKP